MIRILTDENAKAVTVTIDGRLVTDYIEAVESSVHQAKGKQRPVHLFLRDVSEIDDDGRKLLSRMAEKGVELNANGLYSTYVVAEILRESARR